MRRRHGRQHAVGKEETGVSSAAVVGVKVETKAVVSAAEHLGASGPLPSAKEEASRTTIKDLSFTCSPQPHHGERSTEMSAPYSITSPWVSRLCPNRALPQF